MKKKIIEKYKEIFPNYSLDFIWTELFQKLKPSDIFEIIKEAKWRDIKINYNDETLDWGEIIFLWNIDNNFDFERFLKFFE